MDKFLCFLLAGLLCAYGGCSAGQEEKTIELETEYSGAMLDLCAPELRQYLSEDDFKSQCDFLLEHEGDYYDWQNIMLIWNDCGSEEYTVYISEDSRFTSSFTYETEECEFYYGLFRPGKTYYWKVEGSDGATSETDSFSVMDMPVALYSIDNTANVRDMGGWVTESGQKVKYGMLFRGAQLNGYDATPVSEDGKGKLRDILGIKSEIDLRTAGSDDGGQTENYFDPEGKYLKAPLNGYTCIIPEYYKGEWPIRAFDERAPGSLKAILEFLSDEENYPVYIHCNAGADRTGTVAFILNGLLGVPYDSLTKDFEITSFMGMGNRWRGSSESGFTDGIMQDESGKVYVAWGKMYELMMQYYSTEEGTLSSAIENYLVKVCDVSPEVIERIRDIMLES